MVVMKDEQRGGCREHVHDWCAIPLHETGRICAKCIEIREDVLFSPPSTPVPSGLRLPAESRRD
jgi:hypothetical protein